MLSLSTFGGLAARPLIVEIRCLPPQLAEQLDSWLLDQRVLAVLGGGGR